MAEKLYKLKDVEQILGVSRRTLYNYLKAGRLHGVQLSGDKGDWRISETELQRFANQGKTE